MRAPSAAAPGCNPRRDAPPLTLASLSLKTVINPATAANEIVAASVVYLGRVRTDGPMTQVRSRGPVGGLVSDGWPL